VFVRWPKIRRWLNGASALALIVNLAGQAGARTSPAVSENPAQAAPAQATPRAAQPASPRVEPMPAKGQWLAPLSGLAAGLGLTALAERLGFGPTLAPVLLLLALGVVACALALAFASRRARSLPGPDGPTSPYGESWQGIGGPSYAPRPPTVRFDPRPAGPAAARGSAAAVALAERAARRRPFGVPPEFDTPGFLESAKQSFVRLQSAWDRADLSDLGECATDEMFNALTHELRVRVGPSRTEVLALAASLLGIEIAAGEHRASVRFSGTLKVNGEDERLDEVWNLSRPIDGSSGWLLAGIQQLN